MPMAPVALGEDLARLDVESGGEGSCTVAGIVVGDTFDVTPAQGTVAGGEIIVMVNR